MTPSASKEFIEEVRKYATRITSSALDNEIQMLIESCQMDLFLSGISEKKVLNSKDPMIKNAIFNYVRANFGLDNPDSEKYRDAYYSLRLKMVLSENYTESDDVA